MIRPISAMLCFPSQTMKTSRRSSGGFFPVLVGVKSLTGDAFVQMTTQISRATSCAVCHSDPPGLSSVGHVYNDVSPNPNEERQCPVNPDALGDGGSL